MRSLPTALLTGSPCDPSVSGPPPFSTSCTDRNHRAVKGQDSQLFTFFFFHVYSYLYCSCVSRSNFFSSSILSVVSLRTMTSSMVSTTSPFSPRLRLWRSKQGNWNTERVLKTIGVSCTCVIVLTLELQWLPGARSTVTHNAEEKRKPVNLTPTLTCYRFK